MYKIEKLTEEYIPGVGYVHYAAWNETYTGLVDSKILENRSLEKCIELNKRLFGKFNYYIALIDNQVVGFISFSNQSRDHEDCAEILALYVLKKFQKMGIGRTLVNYALRNINNDKINLYVLDNNENAIKFYQNTGFELSGKTKEEKLGNSVLVEIEMIYDKNNFKK